MDPEHDEVRFVPDDEANRVQPVYKGKKEFDFLSTVTEGTVSQQKADGIVSQDSQISVEIEKEFIDYMGLQNDGCQGFAEVRGKEGGRIGQGDSSSHAFGSDESPMDVAVGDGNGVRKIKEEPPDIEINSASTGDRFGTKHVAKVKVDGTINVTSTGSGTQINGNVVAKQEQNDCIDSKEGRISSTAGSSCINETKSDELKSFFMLGMEGSYVMYENQYYSNSLASSKHDHQAERDKRRALGNKFRLYDFKWLGEVYQGPALVVNTLRSTLLSFESSIPTAFLHPMWYRQLPSWIKAVRMCKEVPEFAAMLTVLQRAIKPLIVLNVWRESLGHVLLRRAQAEGKNKKSSRFIRDKDLLEEELDDDENGIIKPKGKDDSIQFDFDKSFDIL